MTVVHDAGGAPVGTAPVRPGEHLDWPALERHLQQAIPDLEGAFGVWQFPNGAANLTYLLEFGTRQLVFRRPPFGKIAPGAHDMRREHRALSGLWRHYDRAPRPLLFCDDHSVVGADFLVSEYRSGEVIWGAVPPSMRRHDAIGHRVGLAVVDALADLHVIDPSACGLADLGRPEGFVERQLAGWRQRWELTADARPEPLMDMVAHRLEARLPAPARVSVLHNDFKLDNCQFDPADPDRVTSVFDWDMATLGDPLVDLGILLNYWPDPNDPPGTPRPYDPGVNDLRLPGRSDVLGIYADRTGLDVSAVGWYEAFACWKTGVTLQQLYARYARGETTDQRMAEKGALVTTQAERSIRILDSASV